VFQAIIDRKDEKLPPITGFLGKTFFSLQNRGSTGRAEAIRPLDAAPFMPRDWPILEKLIANRSQSLSNIYLRLATDYIQSNTESVQRLSEIEAAIAPAVLAVDGARITQVFESMDKRDKQSLFTFRLYGAFNTHARQTIADYFANNRHSDWVKQRLLYPLIYHALNIPKERDFIHVISQVLPGGPQAAAEKAVVTFLLRGGFDKKYSLAFKCYIGLICHPFDTLDIINSHFEELVASQVCPPSEQLLMLRELAKTTGSQRLNALLRHIDGPAYNYSTAPTKLPICERLQLNEQASKFFESFVSLSDAPDAEHPKLGLFESLKRLRWDRYPRTEDFSNVVANAQQFSFCEVGRFLETLLTSIYMVERNTPKAEILNLQRQLEYFGAVTPYTLCSPRGAVANNQGVFGKRDQIEAAVEIDLKSLKPDLLSRWWLKRFHWQQRVHERDLNIAGWLKAVRTTIPLSGNSTFLSGLDWQWLQEVIDALRIKVFSGNPDGIYVLLMRAMETRQREPNVLKLALGPLVPPEGGLAAFVTKLIEVFGENATAFIRYFLTPPMIMKMKLEDNYTAALSERLNALDRVVAKYGLNDEILTAVQYELEARALTNALTFMAVGAAQFEVSWDTYLADAEVAASDSFVAFEAFNKTYNALPILTDANRTTAHIFSNTQVQEYEFRNRDWPLVNTITEVIDVFLSSPSYGIEAILAIRIRHDTLRRELATVFAENRKLSIAYVPNSEKKKILDAIETSVTTVLQDWIDAYMHTPRGSKRGLFNFAPTQDEMTMLVKQLAGSQTLVDIAALTIAFVRRRLEESLVEARNNFAVLTAQIMTAISATKDNLINDGSVGCDSANAVAAVISNSLSHRCDELLGWFQIPTENRKKGLNYEEICRAVEGKFGRETTSGELVVRFEAPRLSSHVLPPALIRPAFDLWSEIFMNAIKYGPPANAVIRVSEFTEADSWGLRFSSKCEPPDVYSHEFSASPTTANEPMLRTGKSGHSKVAALAAVLAAEQTTIGVFKRQKTFHVLVPLGRRA